MTEAKKERESFIPVSVNKLNILVHPLFLTTQTASQYPRAYGNARRLLYTHALSRFASNAQDDVLLVMPELKGNLRDWRENVQEIAKIKGNNPNALEWTDLYHGLKDRTDYPRNVLLADNIVFDPTTSAEKMFAKVASKGFIITPSTIITLGGEYLDACVKITTEEVLDLPFIQSVKIDNMVSIDGALRESLRTSTLYGRDYFLRSFEENYDVRDDGEYIYIGKKN